MNYQTVSQATYTHPATGERHGTYRDDFSLFFAQRLENTYVRMWKIGSVFQSLVRAPKQVSQRKREKAGIWRGCFFWVGLCVSCGHLLIRGRVGVPFTPLKPSGKCSKGNINGLSCVIGAWGHSARGLTLAQEKLKARTWWQSSGWWHGVACPQGRTRLLGHILGSTKKLRNQSK